MTRLIVHAGFHKTGTTSVQATIKANSRRLGRHVRTFLKPDFEALAEAARKCSIAPGGKTLAQVSREAAAFFATIHPQDPTHILLSSEDLAGHMPGRFGLASYAACIPIMARIAEAAIGHFGDGREIVFVFSTRGREDWLRSSYWQNLRATRLTDPFDTYAERLPDAADFASVVAAVGSAAAPARAIAVPLEESVGLAQGPITPLLDLAEVPGDIRSRLDIAPPRNARPDLGLGAILRAFNASGLSDENLRALKRQVWLAAQRQTGGL